MRGFAPHPSREQSPLHLNQKGLRPSPYGLHPTLAAGQEGKAFSSLLNNSLFSVSKSRGKGYAFGTKIFTYRFALLHYESKNFYSELLDLQVIFHPKTPLLFVKGALTRNLKVAFQRALRGDNKNGDEKKIR